MQNESIEINGIQYDVYGEKCVFIESISSDVREKTDSIEIPNTILIEDLEYEVYAIKAECFSGCKKLKSISLPLNLKLIGSKAFSNCESLESVLCGGVVSIANRAFDGCKNLTVLECDHLVYIGENIITGTQISPDSLSGKKPLPTSITVSCKLLDAYYSRTEDFPIDLNNDHLFALMAYVKGYGDEGIEGPYLFDRIRSDKGIFIDQSIEYSLRDLEVWGSGEPASECDVCYFDPEGEDGYEKADQISEYLSDDFDDFDNSDDYSICFDDEFDRMAGFNKE